jgi:hypothetical protein
MGRWSRMRGSLFVGFAEGEDEDEGYVLFRQALGGGPVWFEVSDETFGAEDAGHAWGSVARIGRKSSKTSATSFEEFEVLRLRLRVAPHGMADAGGLVGVEDRHRPDEKPPAILPTKDTSGAAVFRVKPPSRIAKQTKISPRTGWRFRTCPTPGRTMATARTR